jgi:HPt (histidine-containing phosphotransfer) domain-containing protein
MSSDPADAVRVRQFASALPGGLPELIRHFVEQMTSMLADLDAAIAESNVERTRAVAHRSVGTAGVCGAGPLVRALRRIEAAAKEGRVDAAAVAEAADAFVRLRAFLDQLAEHDTAR